VKLPLIVHTHESAVVTNEDDRQQRFSRSGTVRDGQDGTTVVARISPLRFAALRAFGFRTLQVFESRRDFVPVHPLTSTESWRVTDHAKATLEHIGGA
jgi:hypothetical protein